MGVPVQDVLFTVFQSIFQVFLLCLAGFTLSFKGIVDKPTSKVLNHINIALFTPALLFSKVAYFLTPAKLRQLWVIPIFFVVLTGLSAVVAHLLARACRLRRSQVNFATAASMFMNSNSLPVAIMQSLATTVPLLKWGPDDTLDAMFGRSLTYLVVFSTLGMMVRWSYGIHLLSQADEPESPVAPPTTTYRDVDDPVLAHISVDPCTALPVDPCDRHVWHTQPFRSHLPPRRRYTYPHVRRSHLPAVPTSLGDQSESEDTDELDTTEGDSEDTIAPECEHTHIGFHTETEDHTPTPSPRWDSHRPPFSMRILAALTSISPPLFASMSALFCVLVPPVQRVLKSDEMIPFKGALDSAGACSIPLTLLVLGGWFWDAPKHDNKAVNGQEDAKSQGKAKAKGIAERQVLPHHVDPSRASSTTSLSSMIGVVGDVLMGRIHPRRGSGRTTRQAEVGAADDAESGPQPLTHTETEIQYAARSRPCNGANGHASPHASGTGVRGETLTIIVTLLTRMVLVPLLVAPMMALVCRLGWGGEVFEDPVFIVSSMLLIASPPALTLAQISQRAKATRGTGAVAGPDADAFSPFERLLSRTVFWAYLVLTPPITIASVMIGLLLIEA